MNTTRMAGALRAMPASVRPQLTLLKVLDSFGCMKLEYAWSSFASAF